MSENTRWNEKMPAPPPPTPAYQTTKLSNQQKTIEKIKLDLDETRGDMAALKKQVAKLEEALAERQAPKPKKVAEA